MSKILVCLYTKDKQINLFAIGCMINSTLHVNKLFIEQVGKCSRDTFHPNTMENIRNIMRKKATCVIA